MLKPSSKPPVITHRTGVRKRFCMTFLVYVNRDVKVQGSCRKRAAMICLAAGSHCAQCFDSSGLSSFGLIAKANLAKPLFYGNFSRRTG
jgi:hypothetical protein